LASGNRPKAGHRKQYAGTGNAPACSPDHFTDLRAGGKKTDSTEKVKLAMAGKLVADYVHIDQTLRLVQAASTRLSGVDDSTHFV